MLPKPSSKAAGLLGLLAPAVLLALGLGAPAVGADFSFVKVADFDTPIPNGSGITFSSIGSSQISNGVVVFAGGGAGMVNGTLLFPNGVYLYQDGALNVVVDTSTEVPGNLGKMFTGFVDPNIATPSIQDGLVAFLAFSPEPSVKGIYAFDINTSVLSRIADRTTEVPSASPDTFREFYAVSTDGNAVAFFGESSSGVRGIYRTTLSGSLDVIADTNTPYPGRQGDVYGEVAHPSMDGNEVAFYGANDPGTVVGIYRSGPPISALVETGTTLPDGSGDVFIGFQLPSFDDGDVAFYGLSAGQEGIYLSRAGAIHVIADGNTPDPGGTGTLFVGTSRPSLSNGAIAFQAFNNNSDFVRGIYLARDGMIEKVIDENDTLDGKEIRLSSLNVLNEKSLSGDQLVFTANFTDGTKGIFLATPGAELAPTAVAGDDQAIRAGDTVFLDGSASFDDNTASENLNYEWSFSSLPSGSSAALVDPNTAFPRFTADVAGTYVVELTVTDEALLDSAPDQVEISTNNLAPTADAGDNRVVIVNDLVYLDGSGSVDPENDDLTYMWSITTAPDGSTAALSSAGTESPNFTPDLRGVYVITLVVSDFIGPGAPDTLEITATTAEGFAEHHIVLASDLISSLPPEDVTTQGNQTALLNFLSQAIAAIQKENIATAISKLEKSIERTDGCVLRGEPDGNDPARDWITNCQVQTEGYSLLSAALHALAP